MKSKQDQQEVARILTDLVDPPQRLVLACRFGSWFAVDDPTFDHEAWAEWCNVPLTAWVPAWAWEQMRIKHLAEHAPKVVKRTHDPMVAP